MLETIHAPLVKTPGERRRLRKFLERLGDAWYGYGWRSYDYAGHRIVGHRGGVNGYRSLILFDPQKKSGVVALWNSNTSQPGGLEFEVMDMIYRLPFRDWMELDKGGPAAPRRREGQRPIASGEAGNRIPRHEVRNIGAQAIGFICRNKGDRHGREEDRTRLRCSRKTTTASRSCSRISKKPAATGARRNWRAKSAAS